MSPEKPIQSANEQPSRTHLSREMHMFTALRGELLRAHNERNKAQSALQEAENRRAPDAEKDPLGAAFRNAHMHVAALEIAQDALSRHGSDVDKAMGQLRTAETHHQAKLADLKKQIAEMKATGKADVAYKLEREQAEHEDGLAATIEAGKIIEARDQKV